MAHIFKHPTREAKGIIVFTHKEVKYFLGIRKTPILANPITKAYYIRKLEELRKKYWIGVHFGGVTPFSPRFLDFDFVMVSGDAFIIPEKYKDKAELIPLTAINFIPRVFSRQPSQPKVWDILHIARNSRIKRLDAFLRNIRQIYDQGFMYRVLLLSVEIEGESNKNAFYPHLERDYLELFSPEEREYFTLLRPSHSLGFEGLSYSFISHFYHASKVLTLYSMQEGGPMVIPEALLSGLPIVVPKGLVAGINPYLNDSNSLRFTDYDNAHSTLIQAVSEFDNFQIDEEEMLYNFHEDRSLEKLAEYFSRFYEKKGEPFDGKLIHTDRLNVRLPGFLNSGVPWNGGIHGTADILTIGQFQIFCKHLKG